MKNFDKLSERQRNILRFMDRYMDTHGFPPTIREIGEATDINSTSVVNYNLNKLVHAGFLSREDRVSRGLRLVKQFPGSQPKAVKSAGGTRIPMVGQIVASEPVPVPDDARFDNEDLIEVTPSMLGGFDAAEVFALRVKGDSMVDAMISEGDIVIMRRQETAKNGDMVAVWLDERGETTLKQFFHEGERIRLQPKHPSMAPIFVDANHCHVRGRVISVLRHM